MYVVAIPRHLDMHIPIHMILAQLLYCTSLLTLRAGKQISHKLKSRVGSQLEPDVHKTRGPDIIGIPQYEYNVLGSIQVQGKAEDT